MSPKIRSQLLPTGREAMLASFIALSAIDQARFDHPWMIQALLLLVTGALLLDWARELAMGRVSVDRSRSLQLALLAAWVLWSVVSALGDNWHRSLALSGGFAVVLGTGFLVVRDHGRTGVARVLWLGFVVHIGLAGVLLKLTAATPFVDDHLTLASLEANQLARVAALGGIGALWFTRQCRGLDRVAVAATTVGSFMILVATTSRTSAFALAVALVILAVHASRRRLAALALGLLFLLVALPLSGAFDLAVTESVSEITTLSDGELETLHGRSVLWPLVAAEIENSPVSGVGLGNDRSLIAGLPLSWSAQHAHNLTLHLLLTTGFVGAGLMLAAIAGGLVRSVAQVEPFSMALITFVLIDGVSEAVLRVPSFGWFGLCSAVLLTTRQPRLTSEPAGRSSMGPVRRRLPIGAGH